MGVICKTRYNWRPGLVFHSQSFPLGKFSIVIVQDAFSNKVGIIARVYLGADLFELFRFVTTSRDFEKNFILVKNYLLAQYK